MDYSLVRESVRTRVQANNESVFPALIRQLRSPLGVIPFLGAGISARFYRPWGAFLSGVARERLGEADRALAEDAIQKEDYLRAAAVIAKSLGDQDFQQAIADEFDDDRVKFADLAGGTFGYLPLITAGPVITTNFDRVIEQVFDRAVRPFQDKVFGANADEVIPAIQQNRLVLWKIHGDRGDRRTRVFSEKEYQKHYKELPGLLQIAFLNRPAFFIGSSLDKDRTTEVLASVCKRNPGTNHYGFVQIPDTDPEFDQRVVVLRGMGIRPLWYRMGQYQEIEGHLADLVHGISSVPLPNARLVPPVLPDVTPEQQVQLASSGIGELELDVAQASPELRDYPCETPAYGPIVDRITRGDMAFFLGAYACLGRLPLGQQFYSDLLREFGDDSDQSDIMRLEASRIAQYFVDKYGREALYSRVKRQLSDKPPQPTGVHRLIASLQGRLGKPVWVFTTNNDDWMEQALRDLGLRYHLFAYRVSDPYAGSFVYQSPAGAVHVVDRPSHFRRLPEDCAVIVKLHGGVHRYLDLPVSYVFTHRDFVELAGRMSAAIPQVILERLSQCSMLFLGSGLGDDSIESVVRQMRFRNPQNLSWAIQWKPSPESRVYWRQLGLQIVDITLQKFMLELNRRLQAAAPLPTAPSPLP